jgi:hypothetical protein
MPWRRVHHYSKTPIDTVKEMTRVARKGILISASNNIGHDSAAARLIK